MFLNPLCGQAERNGTKQNFKIRARMNPKEADQLESG